MQQIGPLELELLMQVLALSMWFQHLALSLFWHVQVWSDLAVDAAHAEHLKQVPSRRTLPAGYARQIR
jgi:hypothetical protein